MEKKIFKKISSKSNYKIHFSKGILFYFLLILSFFVFKPALAATFSVSSSSSSYLKNGNLSVSVHISSPDKTINAASGNISFPKDKLEVTSISKSGSIFNFWVQEPSFSNNAGSINFEGVVLNPGFSGVSGKIVSINFKVKEAGDAKIYFSSASILANDGQGTNIFSGARSLSISIKDKAAPIKNEEEDKAVTASIKKNEPSVTSDIKKDNVKSTFESPNLISSTNPDQKKWYKTSKAVFSWSLPKEVLGVNLLIDNKPNSNPMVFYSPPIKDKEISGLSDGTWYLHSSFKYYNGTSPVSHFAFNIDTANPEPVVISLLEKNYSSPVREFLIKTSDKTSGIDYYDISIDNKKNIKWDGSEDNIFKTAIVGLGDHFINVKAYDKAGNYSSGSLKFYINNVYKPKIISYDEKIKFGDSFTIKGLTTPDYFAVIYLQKPNGELVNFAAQSDDKGSFVFTFDNFNPGRYVFYTKTVDFLGYQSLSSQVLSFNISCGSFQKGLALFNVLPSLGADNISESCYADYEDRIFFSILPFVSWLLLIILIFVISRIIYRSRKAYNLSKTKTKRLSPILENELGKLFFNIKKQLSNLDVKKSKKLKDEAIEDMFASTLDNIKSKTTKTPKKIIRKKKNIS